MNRLGQTESAGFKFSIDFVEAVFPVDLFSIMYNEPWYASGPHGDSISNDSRMAM